MSEPQNFPLTGSIGSGLPLKSDPSSSQVSLSDSVTTPPSSLDGRDVDEAGISGKDGFTTVPSAPCSIIDLFRYQVFDRPQAPAVQFETDTPVSYGELNKMVMAMAQSLDIKPKCIVPICMDASVVMVAVVLAVLTSGAAYVLLDPESPSKRNRAIVKDTGADFVVVDEGNAQHFPRTRIAEALPETLTSPSPTSTSTIKAEDPAYLVYTSGTTGVPKGAVISHRAATYGIENNKLRGTERFLLFYKQSFSAAQRTILATLCHGATLCLASRASLAGGLGELLQEMHIDVLGITPSALSTLDPARLPTSLQQITTVGEPLSQTVAETFMNVTHLRVSYGCSECAQLNLSREVVDAENCQTVGVPHDTTTHHVLRPDTFEPVDPSETGELCLVGPQLASGYWNRPEADKVFVDSPHGRMYRTGDLVIALDDGSIQVTGRLDNQMKLGGQRLEPEEVTAVLANSKDVEAFYALGARVRGEMSLTAAVVPSHGADWDTVVTHLREQARENLPAYMVPSYWLRCSTLPWNDNLKVDVKGLRKTVEETDPLEMLGAARSVGDEATFAPSDPVLAQIRNTWAVQLRMPPSTIRGSDTFVKLGGSSLDAIRTVQSLREAGISVNLSSLMDDAQLANLSYSQTPFTAPTEAPLDRMELVDEDIASQFRHDPAVANVVPLTGLQESLLSSSLQGSDMYIYHRVFDVRRLDLGKLRLAFKLAIQHSDILRSTFVYAGTRLIRVVRQDFQVPWSTSESSVQAVKQLNKSKGFQLGQPFIRLNVVSNKTLVVAIHHALFDFWSNEFLFEDVARLYQGYEPITRPDYGKYVRHLSTEKAGSHEAFWREYLVDVPKTLVGHDSKFRFHGVQSRVDFDSRAVQARIGATSGAVVYTAWALVLSKLTGLQDVVFATALAGRDADVAGIQDLDGPTLEVVPQRIQLDPGSSLKNLTRSTSAGLWQLNEHAKVGMRQALKSAGVGRNVPFDSFVNILVKGKPGKFAKDIFRPYAEHSFWETGYATLQVEQDDHQLSVSLYANLEERQAQFLLSHFENAIEAIARYPESLVRSQNLVGQVESEYLLRLAQPTDEAPSLLHAAFENCAMAGPLRSALEWQGRSYSYDDLNALANRMAHFLRAHGLGQDDHIPLLLHKGLSMIVSILGILKIGASYVPLSPENPQERNQYIFDLVEAKFVITEESLKQHLSKGRMPTVVYDTYGLNAYPCEYAAGAVNPKQLAYIMFTSGSTGNPKGVQVSHGAACSFVRSMNNLLQQQGDNISAHRTLQFTNYVFDFSIYDIFTTLSSGSCLCIAPTERLFDNLAEVISDMKVTHAILTPTVVKLLQPSQVPTLKTLAVGGEPMTQEILDTWAHKLRLINAYGPTEAAVVCVSRDVGAGTLVRNIGRPLGNTAAMILQPDSSELTPYGGIGELCFTGPQLAQGYYKEPEKTAKVFIDSENEAVGRYYRSGDLARWLPGGELECFGRTDNQVKINGFRIELGEIEAALLRTSVIQHCAAITIELDQTMQIVAFAIFEPGDQDGVMPLSGLDEKLHLMKSGLGMLPPYMVPRLVLPMARMPRQLSGKTDRKALANIASTLSEDDRKLYSFTALGTQRVTESLPLEDDRQIILADCWGQVLGLTVESLGPNDDFFDLGGDSIAAMSLSSFLRSRGFSIKVGDILLHSSLEAMAKSLEEDDVELSKPRGFRIPAHVLEAFQTATADVDSIYMCPAGQAQFLHYGSHEEQYWTVMATRQLSEGTLIDDWVATAKELATRNPVLRTSFVKYGDHWYGGVLRNADPSVDVIDIRDDTHRVETQKAIWDTPFVIGEPFIRYAILRQDKRLEICVKMSHAVYDGVTLRNFGEDFGALARKESISDCTNFDSFVQQQSALDKQAALDFWLDDSRRPTKFRFPQAKHPGADASFTHACSTLLEPTIKQYGFSASALYQTAFILWLSRASDSEEVSYDYLYTGRNVALPKPQSINGTCANHLPLRTHISQTTIRELVSSTQAHFWAAAENGHVSLEDIYAAAGTSRAESGNTALFLFQPFEPSKDTSATQEATVGDTTWVSLPESEVKIVQPYAFVFEVFRQADDTHLLRISHDSTVITEPNARQAASEVEEILNLIVNGIEEPVETILAHKSSFSIN